MKDMIKPTYKPGKNISSFGSNKNNYEQSYLPLLKRYHYKGYRYYDGHKHYYYIGYKEDYMEWRNKGLKYII